MLRGLFKSRSAEEPEPKHKPEGISPGASMDEEIQLPSLHRVKIHMTGDLIRRMEEEQLRKQYHIPPSKQGAYL